MRAGIIVHWGALFTIAVCGGCSHRPAAAVDAGPVDMVAADRALPDAWPDLPPLPEAGAPPCRYELLRGPMRVSPQAERLEAPLGLAYAAGRFGVTWRRWLAYSSKPFLRTFDRQGQGGPTIELAAGVSLLAGGPSAFGVCSGQTNALYLQRLDAEGQPLGTPLLLSTDPSRRVREYRAVWDGARLLLLFVEQDEYPAAGLGTRFTLRLMQLGPDGVRLVPDTVVASAIAHAYPGAALTAPLLAVDTSTRRALAVWARGVEDIQTGDASYHAEAALFGCRFGP